MDTSNPTSTSTSRSTIITPFPDSLPVRTNQDDFNGLSNGQLKNREHTVHPPQLDQEGERFAFNRHINTPQNVNGTLNELQLFSSINGTDDTDITIEENTQAVPEAIPTLEYSITTPTSLSYAELLDLYSNTRVNFLEARDQLQECGRTSAEVYRELDAVHNHLKYKRDHYYYLLLGAAGNDTSILQKLKDKVAEKDNVSKQNGSEAVSPNSPPHNSSQPNETPQTLAQQSQRTQVQNNQTRPSSDDTVSSRASSKSQHSQSSSSSTSKSESIKSSDVDIYLQKVARLRGESAATAEGLRLKELHQPLKRVAIGADTELKFNSILNEINSKSLSKADTTDFFKKNIPPLVDVEDSKTVSDLLVNFIQGYSRELYGSQNDYRTIFIGELLSSFKEGNKVFKYIGENTRGLLRITNWLRRDLKNKDQKNLKNSFDLLERLKLSTKQLDNFKLTGILNAVRKNEARWRPIIEKILKTGEEAQKSNKSNKSSKSSKSISSGPQNSTKTAPTTSVQQTNLISNSSFSRRPPPKSDTLQEPKIKNPQVQPKPINHVPTKSATLPKQQQSSTKDAAATPNEPRKKWSFNNYLQSTKRKVLSSEVPKVQTSETLGSLNSENDPKHSSNSLRSILKSKNAATKARKSVRFSNHNEIREFESDVGHALPSEGENKRAREMESSEAQTLKKHKSNNLNTTTSKIHHISKNTDVVVATDNMNWYTPKVIDFSKLDMSRSECAETRGGLIPIQLFSDLNVPIKKASDKSSRFSPFEPNGLIVDAQNLVVQSKVSDESEISGQQEQGQENENDDDYVLPDVDQEDQTPPTHDKETKLQESEAAQSENRNLQAPQSKLASNTSNSNKNIDQDVLDLLDDDDVLNNTHNVNDEGDYNQGSGDKDEPSDTDSGKPEESKLNQEQPTNTDEAPPAIDSLNKAFPQTSNEDLGTASLNYISPTNTEVTTVQKLQSDHKETANNSNNESDFNRGREDKGEASNSDFDKPEENKPEGELLMDANEVPAVTGSLDKTIPQANNEELGAPTEISHTDGKPEAVEEAQAEEAEVEDEPSIMKPPQNESASAIVPSPQSEDKIQTTHEEKECKGTNPVKELDIVNEEPNEADQVDSNLAVEREQSATAQNPLPDGPEDVDNEDYFVVLTSDDSSSKDNDSSVDVEKVSEPEVSLDVHSEPSNLWDGKESEHADPPLGAKEFTIKEEILTSHTKEQKIETSSTPLVSPDYSLKDKHLSQSSSGQRDEGKSFQVSKALPTATRKLPSKQSTRESALPGMLSNGTRILKIKGAAKTNSSSSGCNGPQKRSSHFEADDELIKLNTPQKTEKTNPTSTSNLMVNERRTSHDEKESSPKYSGEELFPSRIANADSSTSRVDELFPNQRHTTPKSTRSTSNNERMENHTIGGNPVGKRTTPLNREKKIPNCPASDQLRQQRLRDSRQWVRELPSSSTSFYTSICKYFPKCEYGSGCHYIHLNDLIPRHERYETYKPK